MGPDVSLFGLMRATSTDSNPTHTFHLCTSPAARCWDFCGDANFSLFRTLTGFFLGDRLLTGDTFELAPFFTGLEPK